MIRIRLTGLVCILAAGLPLAAAQAPEGFVLVKGESFRSGRGANARGRRVRLEDFEILDHPVTNREYQAFVEATGYAAPLHWREGEMPPDKEEFPVVFVNRRDVEAYLAWLTRTEGRIYRLPTDLEFEYAARGGLSGQEYPWGQDPPEGNANYDAMGDRRFDRWQDYLRPARWGRKNGYGLHGMAGNVWQLITQNREPDTAKYKYRIERVCDIERGVMGGSWARGETHLRCGHVLGVSPGTRLPDIGFRPVRQPEHTVWKTQNRRLLALPAGKGKVHLSWAALMGDAKSTRFNVYRSARRNHAGFRISDAPIVESTTFVDTGLEVGKRYHYYVQTVDASGKEGSRSEWTGVEVSEEASAVAARFTPVVERGSLTPVFGDLNGDGHPDCVIRTDNGNVEMSQDSGRPVRLEAFASYGRSLWRKDVCTHSHCYGSANNVPFNVWDMDHDGRAEVVTRLQDGDRVFVAILDGMTGEVKQKAPWPAMASDFARSSTRIHMAIAYLDGHDPAVVIQTGLYENEVLVAYDASLEKLWQFDSFAETNGSGGHGIEVADVDGDGCQEVFDGTTCLNADGTLRWSIYRQHPDVVSIRDFLPDRPGLEAFYIVETSVHAGVYMVDADRGEVIWKENNEDDPSWTHAHWGWAADVWAGSPGIECASNRSGHNDLDVSLFSADGRVLRKAFPYHYRPMEWDGDSTREMFDLITGEIGDYDPKGSVKSLARQPVLPEYLGVLGAADLYGDFRDELILLAPTEGEGKCILVIAAVDPIGQRYVAPREAFDYRLWLARNMGGGYATIYDQPLKPLE